MDSTAQRKGLKRAGVKLHFSFRGLEEYSKVLVKKFDRNDLGEDFDRVLISHIDNEPYGMRNFGISSRHGEFIEPSRKYVLRCIMN